MPLRTEIRLSHIAIRLLTIALLVSIIASCAMYKTINLDDECPAEGLPYSLPRTVLEVTVTKQKNASTNDLELAISIMPKRIPDRTQRYLLIPQHSAIQDDDMKVSVNANGLLTMVNATTTDQTQNILGSLADTAIDILSFGAAGGLNPVSIEDALIGPPTFDEIQKILRAVAPGSHRFLFVLDPRKDSERLPIPGTRGNLTISLQKATYLGGGKKPKVSVSKSDEYSGIYTRIPEAINGHIMIELFAEALKWDRIRKSNRELSNGDEKDRIEEAIMSRSGHSVIANFQSTIIAPDFSPIVRIPMNRAYFVKASRNVTLIDGMFSSIEIKRPSVINGVVGIPAEIASKIVKIPTELLQLKFDISEKEADIAEQQKNLAETLKALRKLQSNSDEGN